MKPNGFSQRPVRDSPEYPRMDISSAAPRLVNTLIYNASSCTHKVRYVRCKRKRVSKAERSRSKVEVHFSPSVSRLA